MKNEEIIGISQKFVDKLNEDPNFKNVILNK